MNKRQKKKNFKKKYGYNPPSKRQIKRTANGLEETIKMICDRVKSVANKLLLAAADTTNKIRNMSEEEFNEAFSKATPQQREKMKRVREIATKEKKEGKMGKLYKVICPHWYEVNYIPESIVTFEITESK